MNDEKFISINPAAQSDIVTLNEILRSLDGYMNGIEFTEAENTGGMMVQFWYKCPDELAIKAKKLTAKAKEIFDRGIIKEMVLIRGKGQCQGNYE